MSLNEQFILSIELVKGLNKKPNDSELLKLYSLYKQGTIGNCNIDKPGIFSFKELAKWKAWNEQKGKKKDIAKFEYCEYVMILSEKYGVNDN